MKYRFAAAALACMMIMGAAHAAEWGDPAEALTISTWVKGEPITLAEGKGKNIYVVEFWATWCGPCRVSIPHLTELQEKYKDDNVVVIGISDETAEEVKPFVAEMGKQMNYHVALDDGQKTMDNYMQKYGQRGIPTAFVVDKQGRIAWVGHPMGGLEETIDGLIDGSYDIDKMIAERKAADEANEEFESFLKLVKEGSDGELHAKAREYLSGEDTHFSLLANSGWVILNDENIESPDFELARDLLTKALKVGGDVKGAPLTMYNHGLAMAYYKLDDLESAIKHEQIAHDDEEDERYKSMFAEQLEQYKSEASGGPKLN